MVVHVIIVNYRTSVLTVRAAKSALLSDLDVQVCIVDNSELDAEVDVLSNFINHTANVKLVTSVNNGFSAAINLGISSIHASSDDYVLVLNSDAQLLPNTLSNLYHGYLRKSLGLAGAVVLNNDGSIQNHSGMFMPYLCYLRMNKVRIRMGVTYPIGVTLFASWVNLKRVGGFDEDYFLYFEELDMVMAMKEIGLRSDVIDDAFVYHDQGSSTLSLTKGELNIRMETIKLESKINFYKKHYKGLVFILWLNLVITAFLPWVDRRRRFIIAKVLEQFG